MDITGSLYRERAHLLALLGQLYPAHLYRPDDPTPGFAYGVCIHFPWGQAAWHLSDIDVFQLFGHLTIEPNDYDGHTTEEKYAAIRRAIAALAAGPVVFEWSHPTKGAPE